MGEILPPKLVLPLMAVSSRHEDAFSWAAQRMTQRLGKLQLRSDRFPFHQTDYYEATMGPGLIKQFLVPAALFDPAELAAWKVASNQWEETYRRSTDHDELRPINLDPGYLAEDKLVLASTKNHAHRLYLNHGIYGEITLQYRRRAWQTCPWTYPDYQQADYHAFFTEARNYLRRRLQSTNHSP